MVFFLTMGCLVFCTKGSACIYSTQYIILQSKCKHIFYGSGFSLSDHVTGVEETQVS